MDIPTLDKYFARTDVEFAIAIRLDIQEEVYNMSFYVMKEKTSEVNLRTDRGLTILDALDNLEKLLQNADIAEQIEREIEKYKTFPQNLE